MITKSKKVGTVIHAKSGITVDFFLRGTAFFAVVLEKELTAPDASVLRHKIETRIEHWLKLEWHPVIEVETGGGYRSDEDTVQMSFKRYYLSIGPAGSIATVDWDVDEAHRKAKANWNSRDRDEWKRLVKWPLEAPIKTGSDQWTMAYSEETWHALEEIQNGIKSLRKAIIDLVSIRKGVEKLTQGGGRLLLKG
jgi:hypothetical protein